MLVLITKFIKYIIKSIYKNKFLVLKKKKFIKQLSNRLF